ncbi:MAG: serine/threonine-protein kinase [Kofleriaceae bacterium]
MAHRVVVDCDDVMLAIANRDHATLTGAEETRLHAHLARCEACRVLEGEVDDCWGWVTHEPTEIAMAVVERARFELGAEIAAGGMGRITRATDRRLDREVAIKEVLDPRLRARFDREVRITARLQHPAIVPIYEAGTWPDGAAFYTMRLVPGGTLAEAIARRQTLSERLALLPHVIAVTEALAYAHSRRIIHRDLKPGNILVGEFGETVVIDWGLAKELDAESARDELAGIAEPATNGLTRVGSVLGTPGFMAPEQAAGTHDTVDERADVYALGAILYTVLAGSPPHHDELPHDNGDLILELSLIKPPTPLATRVPDLPRDLSAIVERAMSRRREERYPTAKEMAEELRRFAAGQLVATHDYSLRELLGRWLRRHRTAVTVGAVMLVALAIVGVLAVVGVTRSRDAEQRARFAAETGFATSERSVASLLEEQGRYEVLEGDRGRGLAFLAEAVQRGRDGVAIRQLLGTATRNLDLLESSLAFPDGVLTIGFARTGELVVVEAEPRIRVWNGSKQIRTMALDDAPHAATLSDDGQYAAVVGADPAIDVWDTSRGTRLWRLEDPRYSQAQVTIDRGHHLLAIITHGEDDLPQRLEVRALATGALLARPALGPKDVVAVAFGDGKLAACDEDGHIGVWDTTTFASLATLASTARPRILAFARADRLVAAGAGAELWVLGEPAQQRALAGHLGAVTAVAVDDRGWIATGDGAGGVRLWTADGEPRGESRVVQQMVNRLAFAPGGLLVGGGQDPRAYIWDSLSLSVVHTFDAHDEWDGELLVAERGGSRLVTASFTDNVVRVWKLPAPNRIAQVAARAAALAPDRWIVATASTTTIRRLDTGAVVRELAHLRSAEAKAAHLQVSRDGRRAVLQRRMQWSCSIRERSPALARVRRPAAPLRRWPVPAR